MNLTRRLFIQQITVGGIILPGLVKRLSLTGGWIPKGTVYIWEPVIWDSYLNDLRHHFADVELVDRSRYYDESITYTSNAQ